MNRPTNLITLSYRSVPAIAVDLSCWTWFASPDTDTFDAHDYAEAFHLNVHDIDQQSIKSVQDAVNNNFGGTRWIEVTFEKTDEAS
jgi:hypothetical protein